MRSWPLATPPAWPLVRLGDHVVKIGSGATPRGGKAVYVPTGPAFIRSQNVRDNRMCVEGIARITRDAADALRGVAVRPGDVLITITGESVARCCVVDPEVLPARVSQHVAIVRPTEAINPVFLQKFLVQPEYKAFLRSLATGGTRRALTKEQLADLPIALPPRPVQDAIAELLGALDAKIAVNHRIARCADELRRSLLDHDLADGVARPQPIPLSSVADFVNGRAYTSKATGAGRMIVRIAEITVGPSASTRYSDIEVPERHLVRPGDVLFAWSGSLTVARWFRSEAIVNQHIFKVVPKPGFPTWLVFELTRSKLDEFRRIAADTATTLGHIQRRHLDEPVTAPAVEDIPRLDAQLGPLWDRALAAERENLSLGALHDTLLTGLMSGRLRIRETEKLVGDVA